ncbi:hypothetical protein GOBAR_DD18888 [Gossypium barbadense]|nr:hypothetical protein GOBAR_DD18888 [Gossypium barbadense]
MWDPNEVRHTKGMLIQEASENHRPQCQLGNSPKARWRKVHGHINELAKENLKKRFNIRVRDYKEWRVCIFDKSPKPGALRGRLKRGSYSAGRFKHKSNREKDMVRETQ